MAIVKTLIVKGVARLMTDAYMSTIRSGIWNGSTIQVGYGGTGVTSAKGNLYTPVFLSSSGIAACSVEIPHATKAFKINGVTFDVFTNSTGAAPTIFAPTGLASTGGYILATNATKTGLEWVAKPVTDVASQAIQLASVEKTLKVDTWTDMAAVSTYTGTYAIQISDGTLYASGIFSVCGGTDVIIDEIPLHVSSTDATWRPYARISAGQLQMTTNEATGTARTYTIKILKLI